VLSTHETLMKASGLRCFADALAVVRKDLWAQEEQTFCGSPAQTDTVKVSRAYVERLTDALCYAA
jgi:hypothetical protein